jgi:hypothetical protein
VVHGATHMPDTHVRSAAHAVPHMPQFLLSLRTSVHVIPHWRLGGVQPLASLPSSGVQ